MTIARRLIARRCMVDGCVLDRLLEMARLPAGGLDLPALRASVAVMFPTTTANQVRRGLELAHALLDDRPSLGATIHRLHPTDQLDLFAWRPGEAERAATVVNIAQRRG